MPVTQKADGKGGKAEEAKPQQSKDQAPNDEQAKAPEASGTPQDQLAVLAAENAQLKSELKRLQRWVDDHPRAAAASPGKLRAPKPASEDEDGIYDPTDLTSGEADAINAALSKGSFELLRIGRRREFCGVQHAENQLVGVIVSVGKIPANILADARTRAHLLTATPE